VGNEIRTGGTLRLRIVVTLTEDAMRDGTNLAVLIVRDDGVRCYGSSTKVDCAPSCVYPIGGGDYGTTYVIESLPLLAGNYSFLVALQDFTTPHTYDWMPNAAPFTVVQDGRDAGVARILHRWERP
jgi:hypothetical protein